MYIYIYTLFLSLFWIYDIRGRTHKSSGLTTKTKVWFQEIIVPILTGRFIPQYGKSYHESHSLDHFLCLPQVVEWFPLDINANKTTDLNYLHLQNSSEL